MLRLRLMLIAALWTFAVSAYAGGGPLGIDHALSRDDDDVFWSRNAQKTVVMGVFAASVSGALLEGTETRLGKTLWHASEAGVLAIGEAAVLKRVFSRPRPSQINDPNLFFQGGKYQSFPSGEAALVTALVTPVIIEYARDRPEVWALSAIPVYVGIARLKSRAHWQTDVLAAGALGVATGYFTSQSERPLTMSLVPGGIFVGLRYRW